jgi:hypothetical protein
MLPFIKVVIVDEVHQFSSKNSIKAFKSLENAMIRLGIIRYNLYR